MNNKEKYTIQDFIIQLEQINYLEILDVIKPLIIVYISSKAVDAYKLHREYKPKKISKVTLPPELTLEYSEIDINKIAVTKLGESILKFADVLINNFSKEDLTNFYNNINDLKVVPKKFGIQNFIFRLKTVGEYNSMKNEITIDNDTEETVLYHELFHMASSRNIDGKSYSGFHQASLKSGIASLGRGINEGYTELLSQRYFPSDNSVSGSYQYQVFIAEKIEQIVGKEKMQSLYLNSNLKGLIDELKQYVSETRIMKFISNMDFIVNHMADKKLQLFEKNMICDSLIKINLFVVFCYLGKINEQVKEGKISTADEILKRIAEIIYLMPASIKFGKHRYELLAHEDILEIINESLKDMGLSITTKYEEKSTIK